MQFTIDNKQINLCFSNMLWHCVNPLVAFMLLIKTFSITRSINNQLNSCCFSAQHDDRSQKFLINIRTCFFQLRHFFKAQSDRSDVARKGNISASRCDVHFPNLSALRTFLAELSFARKQAPVVQFSDFSWHSLTSLSFPSL